MGLIPSLLFLGTSCQNDLENAPQTSVYTFVKPAHFPEPVYDLEKDPITKEGFLLGRKLFYDPILSLDNSVSCNNCHQNATAFADSKVHPFSIGVNNAEGKRNSPPLMNLAFSREFFWDGGVTHMDFVPINAIESPVEMNETLGNVVAKLNASEGYRRAFKNTFGIDTISSPFMMKAISQFMNLMISANSKYDQGIASNFKNFSTQELEGKKLFETHCASCHQGALFTDQSYRNNGLSSRFADQGRALITERDADIGKFKVPSLRNITKTAPYMHNAAFINLEEVLEHYNSGMVESPSLDPSFRQPNGQLGIPLSPDEQAHLIDFLNTLTDDEFTQNQLFVQYN